MGSTEYQRWVAELPHQPSKEDFIEFDTSQKDSDGRPIFKPIFENGEPKYNKKALQDAEREYQSKKADIEQALRQLASEDTEFKREAETSFYDPNNKRRPLKTPDPDIKRWTDEDIYNWARGELVDITNQQSQSRGVAAARSPRPVSSGAATPNSIPLPLKYTGDERITLPPSDSSNSSGKSTDRFRIQANPKEIVTPEEVQKIYMPPSDSN
jgi:hypothetical protein